MPNYSEIDGAIIRTVRQGVRTVFLHFTATQYSITIFRLSASLVLNYVQTIASSSSRAFVLNSRQGINLMNYASEIVNSGCMPLEQTINDAPATKQLMSILHSMDCCCSRDVISQMTRELTSVQAKLDRSHTCDDLNGTRRQRMFRLLISTLRTHFPGSLANE